MSDTTPRERLIAEDDFIVSKTDPKGPMITESDFHAVSGRLQWAGYARFLVYRTLKRMGSEFVVRPGKKVAAAAGGADARMSGFRRSSK